MPRLINFSTGNSIEIVYDAGGQKLRKIVKTGATIQYEHDYAGGLEYRKTGTGSKRIEAVYHAEGRYYNLNVDANNTVAWRREYALRDHLGNTRLMFADKNGNGIIEVTNNPATCEIIQVGAKRRSRQRKFVGKNHYYLPTSSGQAFGLNHEGPWLMNDAARDNLYQYNGKEWNVDFGLNWNDYGARWYMPDLGRWGQVDPLAEKRNWLTIYNYVQNNPLTIGDPSGALDSPIFDRDGNFLGTDSEGFKGEIIIMDADKYAARLKDTKNPLDHKQVMAWANRSPYVQTLDNYVANDFDIKNSEDMAFLSNVFTNLLGAANDAGIINIEMLSLSGRKIWVVPGHFPSSVETNRTVTIANSDHTAGKMYIAVHIHSANRTEYMSGAIKGTQSLWYMGNSGDAINILGVHEPLHGQSRFRGNDAATHVAIYKEILTSPKYRKSLQLTTSDYRSSLQNFINTHEKK